jgi:hypothetical protein
MKHYKKVRTARKPWYVDKKNESDFASYFAFGDNPDINALESQFDHAPEIDPIMEIARACESWRDSGGIIVRMGFGVRSKHIGFYPNGNPMPRIYEPDSTHVSPEGCVLINREARGDILNDFRAALNVDEYWACGFHHALSQTHTLAGKLREHFETSETYMNGFEAGLEIAATYLMVMGGWREPFHNRMEAL